MEQQRILGQHSGVNLKPVFLSKKQREEQKTQLQEKEKKEIQKKEHEMKKARKEFIEGKLNDDKQQVNRSRSRSKSRERNVEKQNQNNLYGGKYKTSNSRATVPIRVTGDDQEVQEIKMQYLGLNKEKKKMLRPSEKFKNIFNFEWNAVDDTSYDTNPVYSNRIKPNLLFGRGLLAGEDIRDQKKNACDYSSLIKRNQIDEDMINNRKIQSQQNQIEKKDREQEKSRKKSRSNSNERIQIRSNSYDREIFEEAEIYRQRDLGMAKHWSEKEESKMTERDWRILREDYEIIIKGGRVPNPMRKWDEKLIPPYLMEAVRHAKYKKPTPIQMQSIPIGMQRKDMIGIAPTGSGKSVAFLVPMITYLNKLPSLDDQTCQDGPYGLIMAPSRELALQIDSEFQKLAVSTRLRSTQVIGGRKAEEQGFILRKGCEILIGTPGRIKECLQSKYVVLNQCYWVVIDEADKMIELGFEEDVNYILDSITSEMKNEDETIAELQEKATTFGANQVYRVTHLFSATMPSQVERIAKKYLRAYCFISIGEPGGGKRDIKYEVEMISEGSKKHRLQQILKENQSPIIIFVNQKKTTELLSKILDKWGMRSIIYHGGQRQEQRESAVEDFKKKKYDILVATDLAARGLDVDGVKLVVNFDAPKNIQDYTHRCGRTGRAGKQGKAITFLTPHNEELFYDLNEFLTKNDQEVPHELSNHPATKFKPNSIQDNQPRRKQIVYAQ